MSLTWDIDAIKSVCIDFLTNCFMLKEVRPCCKFLLNNTILIDEENETSFNNREDVLNYLLNEKNYIGYQILNLKAYKTDINEGVVSIVLYIKDYEKIPITFSCIVEEEKVRISKIYLSKSKIIDKESFDYKPYEDISDIFEIQDKVDVERENLINSIDGGYCKFKIIGNKLEPLSFSYKLPSFLGYERKEFSEIFFNNILSIIPQETLNYLQTETMKAMFSDKPYSTTVEVLSKNGERSAIFTSIKKLRDNRGSEVLNVLLLGKNYEVKLNKDILNNIRTGIIVLENNSKIIFSNKTAKQYITKHEKIKNLIELNNENSTNKKVNRFGEFEYEVKSNLNYFEITEKKVNWLGEEANIIIINDISQRKMMLKSISQNSQNLDIAIKSLNAFYWTYFGDKDSLVVGKSYKEAFYLESQIISNIKTNLPKLELIHPSDIKTLLFEIDKTSKGYDCEIFCIRMKLMNNGDYRWCKLHNNLISEKNEPSKILITIQDISEDMTSMKQYLSLSDQFEYEASGKLASYIINLTKNTVEKIISTRGGVNYAKFSTASAIYGFSKNCRIGDYNKSVDEKYMDVDSLLKSYHEGITNYSYVVSYSFNEKKLWVEKSFSLVKNPITNDIIAFHSIKDATNEIQINQILDYIVEKHFDFIVRVNLNSRMCNLIINPKYAPQKGKSRYIYPISKLIEILFNHGDLKIPTEEEYIALLANKLKNTDYYEDSLEYNELGVKHRKKINLYKLDEIDETVIVACSDITALTHADKKQAETLTAALERANQANKAKTTFLSAMSHDIRTPINAIVGMTRIALQDINNKDQILQSLSIIENSSIHLLNLINEILEMSAIESGKHIINNESLNIVNEVSKVVDRLYPIAKQKNININVENYLFNPICLGDKLLISRIVENITNNAIKFTPKNGKVTIKIDDSIKDVYEKDYMRISISDSGFGIESDKINHIFESFYRVGNAAKGDIEGTGLGLSITKGLVDSIKGNIKVESIRNQGTTFYVDIPLIRVDKPLEKKASKKIVSKKVLSNLNILIFEDHPINLLVVQKMLENAGANVICAEDGRIGIEKYIDYPESYFDIIFMDIQMPNLDGYEATKLIRELNREDSTTIPIIAMTANAFDSDVKECLKCGMNSHIAKPIEMNIVINEVKKALNKKAKKSK